MSSIVEALEGPMLQVDIIGQSLATFKSMLYHTEHGHSPIDVFAYFPQSIAEFDIQQFHLSRGKCLPPQLTAAEDIVMWLLATETIDREIVADFLTDPANAKVLDLLAAKIAALEAANGLIEGLRIYLPVVGGVRRAASSHSTDVPFLSDRSKLSLLLAAYAKAHLQHCAHPVLNPASLQSLPPTVSGTLGSYNRPPGQPVNSTAAAAIVSALLMEIVGVYSALAIVDRPLSVVMMEFFQSVRQLLNRLDPPNSSLSSSSSDPHEQQQRSQLISPKTLTEIFNTITAGSVIAPLPSLHAPSFLLANILFSGLVRVGYHSLDDEPHADIYQAKLMHDAMYLLAPNEKSILACLPLNFLRPQLADDVASHVRIELCPAIDCCVPYIFMAAAAPVSEPSVHLAMGPSHVSYYPLLTLEAIVEGSYVEDDREASSLVMLGSPTDPRAMKEYFKKQFDVTIKWLGKLEAATWNCRQKNTGFP